MLLGIGAMPQNQDAADEPILTAKKGDDMRQLPEPPRVIRGAQHTGAAGAAAPAIILEFMV